MSNASKQPTESESTVGFKKHRIIWGIFAAIVALAFISFWVLNNYGTPAKPGMPDPIMPAKSQVKKTDVLNSINTSAVAH